MEARFTEDQYRKWELFFKQLPSFSNEVDSDDESLPDPEMAEIRVSFLLLIYKLFTFFFFRQCAQSASALQVTRRYIFYVVIISITTA